MERGAWSRRRRTGKQGAWSAEPARSLLSRYSLNPKFELRIWLCSQPLGYLASCSLLPAPSSMLFALCSLLLPAPNFPLFAPWRLAFSFRGTYRQHAHRSTLGVRKSKELEAWSRRRRSPGARDQKSEIRNNLAKFPEISSFRGNSQSEIRISQFSGSSLLSRYSLNPKFAIGLALTYGSCPLAFEISKSAIRNPQLALLPAPCS
jgi:hypothetical protein